ncbi:hypothetical protein [Dethiobacter alkaliphilus]|uniref:Uncharacterized protein n=1 Tax=Dethiobacter alkaliphilus AHT 1 TaxID=555088 RepID=C0GI14_DETAL|nr:hypothetical protein [Dethiobacter alkaliphilus]EEG77088.1 hypothetical protein DealDRAFT_2123 [Dethiobacter alkaliphilus AHT 1]
MPKYYDKTDGGGWVERIKILNRKLMLLSNVYLISFSSLLLVSILLNNKNAIAITMVLFSLPIFISEVFYHETYPWPALRELQDYEKKHFDDGNREIDAQRPLWQWAVIPIIILVIYLTDLLYVVSSMPYYLVFLLSAGLIADNRRLVEDTKKIYNNPDLTSYVKNYSMMLCGLGIVLFVSVVLIIRGAA